MTVAHNEKLNFSYNPKLCVIMFASKHQNNRLSEVACLYTLRPRDCNSFVMVILSQNHWGISIVKSILVSTEVVIVWKATDVQWHSLS